MLRRIAPLHKRRQSSQRYHPSIIFYDREAKLEELCRICKHPSNLIAVCDCNFKYHEKCLLNFIKQQMKKALTRQLVFSASSIKCPVQSCQKQISFIHQQKTKYGCDYFCEKFKQNTCNKHLVLLLVLFLILAAFMFTAFYLGREKESNVTFVLFCVFTFMSLIVGVSIIGVLIIFFSRYLQIKQIYLKSIIKPKLGRFSEGGSSSSSEQNKIYECLSDNFQIYVEE